MINTTIKIFSINSLTPEERKELFSEMMDDSLDEISHEIEKENGVRIRVRRRVQENGNNSEKNPFNSSQR